MSAVSNKYTSCEEVTPIVRGNIFDDKQNSRFALGVFRPEDVIPYDANSFQHAYFKLRAGVYIDRTGILGDKYRRDDGSELDDNDERSTHLILFENRTMGRVAIFGCMRLIEKNGTNERPLPIEDLFVKEFPNPAPAKSVEVSRFIVCHDDADISNIARKRLMVSAASHVVKNNLGPVYAVVEPTLERGLKLMRLPLTRVAEPQIVGEYSDENLGIEIDPHAYHKRLGELAVRNFSTELGSVSYWGDMMELRNEEHK